MVGSSILTALCMVLLAKLPLCLLNEGSFNFNKNKVQKEGDREKERAEDKRRGIRAKFEYARWNLSNNDNTLSNIHKSNT